MFVKRGLFAAVLLGLAGAAQAADFQVTNTNTSGAGSLHQAILDANLTAAADTVSFAIAGIGVKTIAGNLPDITQPLTIDGYTQSGTAVNTAGAGSDNATLRIVLSGASLAAGEAVLDVKAANTTVRGLVVNNVPAKAVGIRIGEGVTGASIRGCFVGTNAAGRIDSTTGTGIVVEGTATIGTGALADRNLISGNDGIGVQLAGPDSVVQNNMIGLDADGNADLGNGTGIEIRSEAATDNSIGGTGKGQANDIAGNTREGVKLIVDSGNGNRLETNRIHDNGGLGIDINLDTENDDVTRNDENDGDTGPNRLQNFPELAFARVNGSTLRIQGLLNSTASQFRIEFFLSDEPDDSGFGEGQTFVGATTVVIPFGENTATFVREIALGFAPTGPVLVTATAQNQDTGDTSEFSRVLEAPLGGTEITVTNANASGAGSLRAALDAASANTDPNTIVFAIPGDGPHIITPTAELGLSDTPAIIDGYTQPGATINTAAAGTNATPRIVIDGSQIPTGALLGAFRGEVHVWGVVLRDSTTVGLRFVDCESSSLEGSFVGTDPTGTVAAPHTQSSVTTGLSADTRIGGPSRAQRNLISGSFRGINDTATGSVIVNNLIGTDASGLLELPNDDCGIEVRGTGATIGGDEVGLGNVIRGNGEQGIRVGAVAESIAILGNDIFDNFKLGIDLVEAPNLFGVTANDVDDADDAADGGNALQNFPVITAVTAVPGELTVDGTLDIPADQAGEIHDLRFFRNTSCDVTGHGEGELFVGAIAVAIQAAETFHVVLPATVEAGDFLTATATPKATGATSEFSACFEVEAVEESVCGDANSDSNLAAGDALIVLNVAVGNGSCELCRCDVNGNGDIQTGDALLALKAAVGQTVALDCPACE